MFRRLFYPDRTARSPFGIGSLVLTAVFLIPTTDAEEATPPRPADLIAQLDDASFEQRSQATDTLLTDDALTPEKIAEWVPLAESPEQQHRLLMVAEHHTLRRLRDAEFADEGPGSMGVVQTVKDIPHSEPPKVYAVVSRVLLGFPAAGRLRPMDRIVAIAGEPIPGPADARIFEAMMRRYRAGDRVDVTIERGDSQLEVTIPLVNGRALASFYKPPLFDLHEAAVEAWETTAAEHFAPLLPTAVGIPTPSER